MNAAALRAAAKSMQEACDPKRHDSLARLGSIPTDTYVRWHERGINNAKVVREAKGWHNFGFTFAANCAVSIQSAESGRTPIEMLGPDRFLFETRALASNPHPFLSTCDAKARSRVDKPSKLARHTGINEGL